MKGDIPRPIERRPRRTYTDEFKNQAALIMGRK